MYQALYRKYRPKSFSDVTGQEHITDTLRRQIMTGRLSHAYLFVGTRGTGKTTCAKILSRAVNCLSPIDGDPCNQCKSCIGIDSGSILDVLELDAASNNGVDNVRALRDEAIYTPASVNKRVYIVDEVHMLTIQAFNALLKILEEPPEHLIFILATTDRHKVPATILSRCQRFSFKRPTPEIIRKRLSLVAEKEGLTLTDDAAEKLAAMADGSFRDGLSLLDQCATDTNIDLQRVLDTIGLAGQSDLIKLVEAASRRDAVSALSILDMLYNDGRDMASLLNELTALMRDLLVFKLSPESSLLSGGFSRTELAELSKVMTTERLFANMDVLKEAFFGLSRAGSSKLSVEMCLIKLCDERLMDDNAGIMARIARLEERPVAQATAQPVQAAQQPAVAATAAAPAEAQPQAPHPSPASDKPDGIWEQILEQLKDDPSIYFSLSDSAEVSAQFQENILSIAAKNPFSVTQIESSEFSDAIKAAAKNIVGREIIIKVRMDESGSGESQHDKLEKLVDAFSIVNFE
ncbi:MAG: DNA polymerase III subunit gamma/tau [Oscillospiraceae bacterium]|nr:DNA polymerase III subunit gamma/tau [Oscillospiraceae bacterium]